MVGKKTPYNIATCSSTPVILGLSPYQTQNELLDIAIKADAGEIPHSEQLLLQRMGDLLEGPLCEEAGRMLGLDWVKTDHEEPIKHEYLPLMGSLDATGHATNLHFKSDMHEWLILPEKESLVIDGPGVIECKCTRNAGTDDIEDWRGVIQAKSLMECGPYNWAIVIVLWQSTDFRIYMYGENTKEFRNKLSEACIDFKRRVIEKDYYPPVTTNDANVVYKESQPTVIGLPDKAKDYINTINNGKQLIKDLQASIDDAEKSLKELIQDNEIGEVDNYVVKWPMINYKAKPERIVPAKDAHSVRAKTLRIKKYD